MSEVVGGSISIILMIKGPWLVNVSYDWCRVNIDTTLSLHQTSDVSDVSHYLSLSN